MKVYRELTIRGEPDKLDAVGEDIRRSLADGWTSDADADEHMRSGPDSSRRVFCFASPKRPRRPAATIFLLEREANTLYVGNIVPSQEHRLKQNEYNAILEEFFRRFVEPAATRNGVHAELTEAEADLENWLPKEAVDKLRLFCMVANKRSGSAHPSDRERWFDFIIAAHEAEADLSASMLERWLVEENGWGEEMAERLAIEYEFARGLLARSNGARVWN